MRACYSHLAAGGGDVMDGGGYGGGIGCGGRGKDTTDVSNAATRGYGCDDGGKHIIYRSLSMIRSVNNPVFVHNVM